MKRQKVRYFIDLFAGCGGLSLGLEQAGFAPAFVAELNPDAMETYLLNRDGEYPLLREKYNINDVKTLVLDKSLQRTIISEMLTDYGIDINEGELDLLVGGPPCQGYSGIGHRRSYSVEKDCLPSNHLYLNMVELIKVFKPKAFLFENVKGILSGRWTSAGEKGEIWADVVAAFHSIPGYTVRWKLIQAKNYGVPQNRPRVLLVGARNDVIGKQDIAKDAIEAGFIPAPSGDYPNLVDLLGDLIEKKVPYGSTTSKYTAQPRTDVQKKLRTRRDGSVMGKGDQLAEQEYGKHSERIIEKFQHMLNNNGEVPEQFKTKKFAQRVLPKRWDENGPTITATCLPDDYVHFQQARVLTVREWARLQMFPDWYMFAGKRTTGGLRRAGNPREGIYDRELPKYTQIGNAVPVLLAEKIGENFIRLLGGDSA
jgi:DNA (cytosine-5)-methyltransferase 1